MLELFESEQRSTATFQPISVDGNVGNVADDGNDDGNVRWQRSTATFDGNVRRKRSTATIDGNVRRQRSNQSAVTATFGLMIVASDENVDKSYRRLEDSRGDFSADRKRETSEARRGS